MCICVCVYVNLRLVELASPVIWPHLVNKSVKMRLCIPHLRHHIRISQIEPLMSFVSIGGHFSPDQFNPLPLSALSSLCLPSIAFKELLLISLKITSPQSSLISLRTQIIIFFKKDLIYFSKKLSFFWQKV